MSPPPILFALIATVALAGCGDDDEGGSSGPDPASIVPASAPVYIEATVKPEGDSGEQADAALGGLLGTDDPGAKIVAALEDLSAEEGGEFSYAEDVEPWLGERAAAFFLDFDENSDGAFVVSTTDEDAARESIERLAEEEGETREATYEGFDYVRNDAGDAAGIVDGFAVLASDAGFKAAVDAASAEPLSESDAYAEAVEPLSDEPLVSVYADPTGIFDALAEQGGITAGQSEQIAAQVGDGPLAAALGAADDQLYAEFAGDSELAFSGGAGDLFDRIPEDAWLALGAADLGDSLQPVLEAAPAGAAGAGSLDPIGSLEAETGIDVQAVADFAGDGAAYVSGTSILGIGGGVAIEVGDEGAARDFLSALERTVSRDPGVNVAPLSPDEGEGFSLSPAEVPIEFPVVLRDGLLIAGIEGSVEQLAAPEATLSDSDAFGPPTDALGDGFDPSVYLDFDPMLELFRGIPDAANDPDFQAALPYLDRLDFLVSGARVEDDRNTVRFVLGLLQGSGDA